MFKINKHKFNNHIFSIILFELRYKFSFFIIIDFSIKPSRDPTSYPRDAHLSGHLKLGTTDQDALRSLCHRLPNVLFSQ
jgi:hypothetical protein